MKCLFLLLTMSFATLLLNAQSGFLDSGFGEDGKVITTNNGFNNAVGLLSTNKIVTAGNGVHNTDTGYKIVLYNNNGALDSSFGKNGFTVLEDEGLHNGEAYSLSILPNDFILTSGGINSNILLVKLKPNGTLDSTFGENGIAITDLGEYEYARSIQVQTDGKIVIAGESEHYPEKRLLVARYMPNGALDESFGDKGKVIFKEQTSGNSVALQKDGKIVVGGYYFNGEDNFLLARLNTDGSYDESFGDNGIVITDFAEHGDYINSVAIQPDGKIVAAGVSGMYLFSKEAFSAARYDENGNLDNSFGTEGKVIVTFPILSEATTVLLQNDGKIILTGETRRINDIFNIALCRLNRDGSIDSTFGANGLTETDFGGVENATSAVLQKDGKIIIAGNSYINNGSNDIIARYNNNISTQQNPFAKIKRWLHHHGFTWDDWPGNKFANYAVQRSSNGVNWTTVNRRQTTANSQQPTANNYVDPSPLSGTNYYRLQTTSTDGAVNYSNVIAVSSEFLAVSISPNPAKNVLHIQGLPSNTNITVVDFTGNMAISQQLKANSQNSYNLNIAQLKQGNYLLKIETNGNVVTKKFVKE